MERWKVEDLPPTPTPWVGPRSWASGSVGSGRSDGRRTPIRRRLFLHLDIDAFLASVAQILEPGLIGKPVVVGSGVVASRSYEAKARGVATAMPIAEALRVCPGLVRRAGDAFAAERFRRRVARVLMGFAPRVEITSLDDMYADLSGMPGVGREGSVGGAREDAVLELCERLRAQVRAETGLSVSLGLGATRTLARLATDRAKPGGIHWVRPGEERSFLDPLPVSALPGIGRKTAAQLEEYRIRTVAELRLLDRTLLEESFGKRGEEMFWKARGLPAGERDQVVQVAEGRAEETVGGCTGSEAGWGAGGAWAEGGLGQSLSRETTLEEPSADPGFMRAMLAYLVDRASARLREQGRRAGRLQVRLRSERSLKAARRVEPPSAERGVLVELALEILEELLARRCMVSRIGLSLERLMSDGGYVQGDLFSLLVAEGSGPLHGEGMRELQSRRLDESLDRIRNRYGFGAMTVGPSIALLGKLVRTHAGFRMRTPSLSL